MIPHKEYQIITMVNGWMIKEINVTADGKREVTPYIATTKDGVLDLLDDMIDIVGFHSSKEDPLATETVEGYIGKYASVNGKCGWCGEDATEENLKQHSKNRQKTT